MSDDNLPGVLTWLVEGLKTVTRLRAKGIPLPVPAKVAATSAEYFHDADNIGVWRDACLDAGGATPANELYESFKVYEKSFDRKALGVRSFGLWMGRDYTKTHTRTGKEYDVTIRKVEIPA